jgi:hypothetical protein
MAEATACFTWQLLVERASHADMTNTCQQTTTQTKVRKNEMLLIKF